MSMTEAPIKFIVKQSRVSDDDYMRLVTRAFNAGTKAAGLVAPPASVIVGKAHGRPVWGPDMFGRRGQAWISFPSTCPFARWVRKHGYGSNLPSGGYGIFVRAYGQDAAYKRAFAKAFAETLRDGGVKADAHIMMD